MRKMLEDIEKNNNKTILLVTDNIQHYQQQFNKYNINNYRITFVKWNDVSTFITNSDDTKRKNLELIIFDIVTATEDSKTSQISTTTIGEIKKIFHDKRIFFILLPYQPLIDKLLSMGICKQEEIRIQPFSVFDIIDLISLSVKF